MPGAAGPLAPLDDRAEEDRDLVEEDHRDESMSMLIGSPAGVMTATSTKMPTMA